MRRRTYLPRFAHPHKIQCGILRFYPLFPTPQSGLTPTLTCQSIPARPKRLIGEQWTGTRGCESEAKMEDTPDDLKGQ